MADEHDDSARSTADVTATGATSGVVGTSTDVESEAEGQPVASSVGRRRLLRRGGVVGAAAVGGLVIVPSPPSQPATIDGRADGDADAPYQGERLTDEDDAPIARYQYRRTDDDYEPTAPINVVFVLEDHPAGLVDVMDVLADAGWTDRIEEYARYAWSRDEERFVHQMATAAESYLGLHGRLHVRCWLFEDVVSMQAHVDTSARPRHAIASYADARSAIESRFLDADWQLATERVDLDNEQRDHDGTASILLPPSEVDQ